MIRIVRRFPRVRLLVVGDLMLDQFIWGKVSRISPEAPVPVVHVASESFHLGGGANVAANIRALGGHARVVGIVGRDEHGRRVLHDLRSIGAGVSGVIQTRAYPTIQKTRIIAHQQQVVRLDREEPIGNHGLAAAVLDRVEKALRGVDAVVVSDYGKGVVTPDLLSFLAERCGRKPMPMLFIDPKKGNFAHYRQATLVKPNVEAASQASGIEIVDDITLRRAGERLVEMWQAESVLISRGEDGMTLFRREKGMKHFPTAAREIFDVTGAGDSVLSTAALALGAGASFEEAAELANRAAGIVVGKIGTASAAAEELIESLRRSST